MILFLITLLTIALVLNAGVRNQEKLRRVRIDKKRSQINTKKYLRIIDIKNLLDKISNKKNKLDFVPTPEGYDDKVYKKPIIKADKNFINKLKTTFNWYKDTRKKLGLFN